MERSGQIGLAITFFLLSSTLAFGQSATPSNSTGPHISGLFSGSFGDGGAASVLGATFGYRFTPRLGVEFEVARVSELRFSGHILPLLASTSDLCAPLPSECPNGSPVVLNSRPTTFLTSFVVEFPTASARFRPYAIGGLGVARISQQHSFGAFRLDQSFHQNALTLSAGGGLDIQVFRGIAVGGDIRYVHFAIDQDALVVAALKPSVHTARVGTRVTYRF